MGLLDADIEKPQSKALRYVFTAMALAILIALGLWYALRFMPEKRTIDHFMDALLAGDTQQAYQIWHPHSSFTYQDFLGYWGPQGYYSPMKSYRIKDAAEPPEGGSGIIIVLDISPDAPFPSTDDAVKSAQVREIQIWVERADQSLSFPPP